MSSSNPIPIRTKHLPVTQPLQSPPLGGLKLSTSPNVSSPLTNSNSARASTSFPVVPSFARPNDVSPVQLPISISESTERELEKEANKPSPLRKSSSTPTAPSILVTSEQSFVHEWPKPVPIGDAAMKMSISEPSDKQIKNRRGTFSEGSQSDLRKSNLRRLSDSQDPLTFSMASNALSGLPPLPKALDTMIKSTAPSLNQVLFNLTDFPLQCDNATVLRVSSGSSDSKKDKKQKELNSPPIQKSKSKKPNKLHLAILNNDLSKIRKKLGSKKAKTLLAELDAFDQTPLLLAIVQDNEEAVKLILEYCKKHFLDINAKDSKGNTLLHLAAMHAGESTISILQLLRFEHLQVNIGNLNGSTPLHYFAQTVRPEKADQIIYQLILAGADPNYQNNSGETPLHRATLNRRADIDVAKALIKYGARINVGNHLNETALHWAVRMCSELLVLFLVKRGADPHVMSVDNETAFDLALTLNNKRIFNCLSEETAKTPVSLDAIPKAPPILQVPTVSPSIPKSTNDAMRKAPDTLRPKERAHHNANQS